MEGKVWYNEYELDTLVVKLHKLSLDIHPING